MTAVATAAIINTRALVTAATLAAVTSNSNAVGADHRDTNNCDQDRNTSKKSTIHKNLRKNE